MGSSWSDNELNKALNRYYADKVKMSKENTRQAKVAAIPIVRNIVGEIHRLDSRFSEQPHHEGSFYQGLKVGKADEFDMNVVLTGIGKLTWNDLSSTTWRQYEFNDGPLSEDPCKTFPYDREIVRAERLWYFPLMSKSLEYPPDGYCFVRLERQCALSWNRPNEDLIFDGDLIPYLVKKKLKDLLAAALTNLQYRDGGLVRASRYSHGPALTIKIHPPNQSPIDVDFAVIIEAGIDIPSWIKWPRWFVSWPSRDKISKIENVGINLVAKKNFYWMLSFAKMEKELVDGIDKDGGCRKQVHRLTKKFLRDIWCPTTKPVVSSYHLKNILFWECEKNPSSYAWQKENLSIRFSDVVKRLREAIRARHLALYFHPTVNLLLHKDTDDLDLVGKKIDIFLSNPQKYL